MESQMNYKEGDQWDFTK